MNGTEEQRRELRTSLTLLVEEYMERLSLEIVIEELNHCLRTSLVQEAAAQANSMMIEHLPEPVKGEVLRSIHEAKRKRDEGKDRLED